MLRLSRERLALYPKISADLKSLQTMNIHTHIHIHSRIHEKQIKNGGERDSYSRREFGWQNHTEQKVINTSFALKTMNFMRAHIFLITVKRSPCFMLCSFFMQVSCCCCFFFGGNIFYLVRVEMLRCTLWMSTHFPLNILTIFILLHPKRMMHDDDDAHSIFWESFTFCGLKLSLHWTNVQLIEN